MALLPLRSDSLLQHLHGGMHGLDSNVTPYSERDVKFCSESFRRGRGFLPCFALPHSFTVLCSIWWCSAPTTCPVRAALGDLAAWPGPSGHFTLILLTWTQHTPELTFTSAPHFLYVATYQPQRAVPWRLFLMTFLVGHCKVQARIHSDTPACAPTPYLGLPGFCTAVSRTAKGCTVTCCKLTSWHILASQMLQKARGSWVRVYLQRSQWLELHACLVLPVRGCEAKGLGEGVHPQGTCSGRAH